MEVGGEVVVVAGVVVVSTQSDSASVETVSSVDRGRRQAEGKSY